jgi:hypothetical protein
MSVRELVKAIQVELRGGDVVPSRARELLMTLTSLYGNCLQEVTSTKQAYTAMLSKCLDEEKKANRARIRAEQSDEFKAWEVAKNTESIVLEMVRSLKTVIKSIEEEMRLAR